MNEIISDRVHASSATDESNQLVDLSTPQEGTVEGSSSYGLFVNIKGRTFFCPYDQGGNLIVTKRAYFRSVFGSLVSVSLPAEHEAIVQVAFCLETALTLTFAELDECQRRRTKLYPKVTSILTDKDHLEVGLRVMFAYGLLKSIPGFIPVSRMPSGAKLEEFVGRVVTATIAKIQEPGRTTSGHVEFSTI